ncbi:carbamoyl-phosphate synthase arginine-specific small chain-like [Xenia sp. Carnegie-2017]|uniref:carbamoyl-phosphate synthase arginine-specific small chain-like n=1 Tax=Xenia sp. Carnegie-2017 TaxID=2897299 RepID=UPI001F0423DE|nr:carbamoyl-phosphate synthase arginine-specific small chain-like [Xenia sp. Carnegie-2017]
MASLVLEDGTVFKGNAFGSSRNSPGEVVFQTGMVGYPESLTDPSYRSQILVLTYPLVGNYGIPDGIVDEYGIIESFESKKLWLSGLIIGDDVEDYSHWSAKKSLSEWLKEYNIPGIHADLKIQFP